ncbi:MAG: DUF3971 domain-containing protein [Candidatus Gastranaerophilales bacterium]|nr:DUF3971 domain-containing protein [Candidatus Gastranaerophilales bacterium]
MTFNGRLIKTIFITITILFAMTEVFYIKFLPSFLNDSAKIEEFEKLLENKTGYKIFAQNCTIKTYMNFDISAKSSNVEVFDKNEKLIFNTKDIYIRLNPLPIIFNKIKIKEFTTSSVFTDLSTLYEIYAATPQEKRQPVSIKADLRKSAVRIDKYSLICEDKKLKKKIELDGSALNLKPEKKDKSVLTTSGNLVIDKVITSYNLNVDGKFLLSEKSKISDYLIKGYIDNIDLQSLSPYLDTLTEYKNAKGLINIKFDTETTVNKEKISVIDANIKDLSINEGILAKQIIAKGLSEFKVKAFFSEKKIKIHEFNFLSDGIKVFGYGKIKNYLSNNPNIDLIANLQPSSVEEIVMLLPSGICPEIDLIKANGFFGTAKGVLKITGKVPDVKFFGEFDINDVHAIYDMKDTHSGNIHLKFKDTTVYVTVDVKTNKGETFNLDGYGRIYDDDWSVFDIKTSDNLDLKLVIKILKPVSKIFDFDIGPVHLFDIQAGTGGSKMHIKGTKQAAFIDGYVRVKNAVGDFSGINGKLTDVDVIVDFNGEDILFENKKGLVENNPVTICGKGSTTGKIDMNVISDNFNGQVLQRIAETSEFLEDAKAVLKTIDKISGNVKFNVNLKGQFDTNIPIEKLVEESKNLDIKGKVTLNNNFVSMADFPTPVGVSGNISFTDKTAETDNLQIKIGKSSTANLSFKGKQNKDNLSAQVKISSPSMLLSDSLAFISTSNLNQNKNIIPNTKDIYGIHSLDLTVNIVNDDIDINSANGKISFLKSSGNNHKITVSDGTIILQKGNAYLDNFKILFDKSKLNAAGTIKGLTAKKPACNLNIKGSDISINSLVSLKDFYPKNIYDLLSEFKDYAGTVNINVNSANNGFSGNIDLKNFSLRHIKTDIPVKFDNLPVKLTPRKISLEKITGEAGKTGAFPIYSNFIVENYTKIPVIKGSVSLKPSHVFVERYINTKLTHPVKMTGDVIISADINGSVDSLRISPTLKLNKDSDISYLTVNIGDTDYLREIKSTVLVQPKNIIVKNMSYYLHNDKLAEKLIWTGAANLTKKGDVYLPTYANFKTLQDRPAKILNFLFKKSMIKNGTFNCNIEYKDDFKNQDLLGYININNAEIPSYNLYLKNTKLAADKRKINLSSSGTFVGNDFSFVTDVKNSFARPVIIENLSVKTNRMDLDKLVETINKWSIEAYSDVSVKNSFDFNVSDIIINNGIIHAKNIDFKDCPIQDLIAKFRLDKNGELKINAENFKIANGSAENQITYNLKNGDTQCLFKAKAIDSNTVASAFLGLKNQIKGNAEVKVSFNTTGFDAIERLKNTKGIIYFSIKDGNMPKLGSMEYLLRASNLIYSGLTTLSVNNLIEILKPFKSGDFSTITGIFNLNNGMVENLRIYSQGTNMSLFINGNYNIEDCDADVVVYGKLGRKIENIFGPLGNISANTIFNLIPRDKNEGAYTSELKKIPDIEYKNQDVKYFRATVNGNINENNSASSFKWL